MKACEKPSNPILDLVQANNHAKQVTKTQKPKLVKETEEASKVRTLTKITHHQQDWMKINPVGFTANPTGTDYQKTTFAFLPLTHTLSLSLSHCLSVQCLIRDL